MHIATFAVVVLLAMLGLLRSGAAAANAPTPPRPEGLPSAVWMAPILAGGGYSSEAISYAVELSKQYGGSSGFGLRQFAEHENADFIEGLPDESMRILRGLFAVAARRKSWDVAICHATPDVWHADGAFGWGRVQPCPPRGAKYRIGRTMYETDRLPAAWVPRINKMDEVWVPSDFAANQFASSGVERRKIVVVPEAVDVELFDPARHDPLELPGSSATSGEFRFLSVFKWEKRKGWDLLLKAFFEEFAVDDPVVLYVKTQAFHSDSDFDVKVRDFAAGLKTARQPLARYHVLSSYLPLRTLPRLYRAAHAFVLPSRGEGWGRPHVEAMSMALPVIATNWSGSQAFLSDACALPLPIDGLSEVEEGQGPKGHKWAEPSVPHLRRLMRWVVDHRKEAAEIGQKAREEMVVKFSPEAIVREHVLPQLQRIATGLKGGQAGQEL